jgi:branched-chain amino acid transport system substrate-binding protein
VKRTGSVLIARNGVATAVGVVALCVVAAACGSSSSSPSGSGSPAEHFTGAPIHIAMVADIHAPSEGFDFTEAVGGADAAVAAVNAAGGIKGHKLVLTICDGQGDPNTENACARSVESSNAVATIGDSTFINPMAPLLKGIAEIMDNPAQPTELQASNSFPVTGSAFLGSLGSLNLAVTQIHAKKVTLMAVGPSSAGLFKLMEALSPSLNAKIVNTIELTGTETDLTPQVEQAASNGAQAIILLMPPDNSTSVIAALKQNSISVPAITITLSPQNIKSLGSAINGEYEINYFPTLNDTSVLGVRMFLDEISEYAPGTLEDNTSMIPWLAVHMFAQEASKLPSVTRAAVLNQWTHAKDFSGFGLIPAYSTDKPFTGLGGGFPRAFNDTFWYARFRGSTAYLIETHAVPVPGT